MRKIVFLFYLLNSLFTCAQVNSFSFNINGTPPQGFKRCLEIAGENWARFLEIKIPVKVNVFLVNTNLVPASAITFANGRKDFQKAPLSNVLYPTALANQISGTETNPGEYDMDIYFNLYTNYYFGTANPPSSQQDLITTAMHEIGHGLGFYSDAYVDASNVGSFGNIPESAIFPVTTSFPWKGQDSVPTVFDTYIVRASGTQLWGCAPQFSQALGDSIRSQPLYFSGPLYANAAHNNLPVRLSGGLGTFSLGTDILHIHQSYQNTIMSYGWGAGDTVRSPAPHEMGILQELGWKRSTVGLKEKSRAAFIAVFPNPSSITLTVTGDDICRIFLLDMHGNKILSKINHAGNRTLVLDTSPFDRGLYLLRIETPNGESSTKKIILD